MQYIHQLIRMHTCYIETKFIHTWYSTCLLIQACTHQQCQAMGGVHPLRVCQLLIGDVWLMPLAYQSIVRVCPKNHETHMPSRVVT